MKIALAGCGSIGMRHLVNLVGLAVPTDDITIFEQSGWQQTGWPFDAITIRLRAASAAVPDLTPFHVVLICVPASQHAAWVRRAIADRVPFFVEKPAVTSVSELTLAEWGTDIPHVVGYQLRFHPAVRILKQAFPSGPARFTVACDMATWPGTAYASPLLECSHEIDLAFHLLGSAHLQRATVSRHGWTLLLSHPGDAVSEVRIHTTAADYLRQWEITSIVAGNVTVRLTSPDQVTNYGYLEEVAHVLAVARGEVASRSTLSHARRVVAICEDAVRRVA